MIHGQKNITVLQNTFEINILFSIKNYSLFLFCDVLFKPI
jgi:hypothetical protein